MATQLVTLQQAKDHLQMDHDAADADITLKIELASDIVLGYLKLASIPLDWIGGTGASPVVEVPPRVKAATLLVVGELFKNREASVNDSLSAAVMSLLHRDRDPAFA